MNIILFNALCLSNYTKRHIQGGGREVTGTCPGMGRFRKRRRYEKRCGTSSGVPRMKPKLKEFQGRKERREIEKTTLEKTTETKDVGKTTSKA